MKEILTEWRQYLNEISGMGGASEEAALAGITSLSSKMTEKDVDLIRQIVSIADPTGISSYPDVKTAYDDFTKEQTIGNGGLFLLAILGAIPVIGKVAAPAKVAKLSKLADSTKKAAKIVDTAKDGSKLSKQIAAKADEVQKALQDLHLYVHSFSRGMNPELAQKLLKMGRKGKAVTYSGKAYRGSRVDNFLDLVDQMIIPGIKKRDGADYFAAAHDIKKIPVSKIDYDMRDQLKKVWNSKDWVEIKVPKNAKLDTGGRGALSYTTDYKQAELFAEPLARRGGDKFEVIFQTSGDKFVDVVKTLEKSGVGIDDAFKAEKEVLAIGEPVIEKIFVRRRVN
jgi:hypothetical protein